MLVVHPAGPDLDCSSHTRFRTRCRWTGRAPSGNGCRRCTERPRCFGALKTVRLVRRACHILALPPPLPPPAAAARCRRPLPPHGAVAWCSRVVQSRDAAAGVAAPALRLDQSFFVASRTFVAADDMQKAPTRHDHDQNYDVPKARPRAPFWGEMGRGANPYGAWRAQLGGACLSVRASALAGQSSRRPTAKGHGCQPRLR